MCVHLDCEAQENNLRLLYCKTFALQRLPAVQESMAFFRSLIACVHSCVDSKNQTNALGWDSPFLKQTAQKERDHFRDCSKLNCLNLFYRAGMGASTDCGSSFRDQGSCYFCVHVRCP